MEANIFNFIKYLEKQEGYVTSDSLSRLFHLSPKTVLNRIDQYNELLKSYDIYISKLPRKGIKLELNNEENINTFFEDNYVYFMTPDQRRDYIIMKLLMSSCPISNDEFQDELFVSYSTLQNDLVYVRDLLKKNNLYLSNIRKKGYEIKGEEKNIRQYFSQFVSKKTEIMSFFSIDSEIRIKKDLFYIIN
ncbi:helix-turn-helix domain-containing protein, partial [Aerococcus tenax]|uniref:helix-turn-helix domain-containing protein n=2 Tax=Aerococcaceae TaxID=186827 RepID=UPI0017826658